MKDIRVPRHGGGGGWGMDQEKKPNPNLYYLPNEFIGSYLVKRFESV